MAIFFMFLFCMAILMIFITGIVLFILRVKMWIAYRRKKLLTKYNLTERDL